MQVLLILSYNDRMNIHFIGIKGVSMRALSQLCYLRGDTVTGSDLTLSGHSGHNVDNADIVVYTCAVKDDNIELKRARKLGKTIYERAEFLSIFASDYKSVVAVSGTHGKTTVTAMLAKVFAHTNPTIHIGGEFLGSEDINNHGETDMFITEACEYRRNFLHLQPTLGIVLNAELDHTDYYSDQKDYNKAFQEFSKRCDGVVVFGDDKRLKKITKKCGGITFGFGKTNDYYASNIVCKETGVEFDIYVSGEFCLRQRMKVFGRHNVLNALASFATGRAFGIESQTISDALYGFESVFRRFERIGAIKNYECYSDYAHHPTEIRYALEQAKAVAKKGKTIAVFESHTYSRTKSLASGFALSLSKANEVFLMPIFGAREKPMDGVDSHLIKNELVKIGKDATVFDSYKSLMQYFEKDCSGSGTIIFIGVGDSDKYARDIVDNFNSIY